MTNGEATGARDRSPAYPIVPLEAALTRLAEFEAHFKRAPARPEKVGDAWSIKARGHAARIVAALRYFGLLEYQAADNGQSVVVSDEGRKYLRAQQEATKREIIKSAALRPKQIAKFWNEWGADRPADAACLDSLVLNNGFSEAGARDFLKVYDATISFSKLTDSDKKVPVHEEDEQEAAPVTPNPPPAAAPEPPALSILDRPSSSIKPPEARGPMLQETFNLDEGPVTLTFPAALSEDSYSDLEAQFELFLRRAKRRALKARDEAAN